MRALRVIGTILSVFTVSCGLILLLWGAVEGLLGMSPDGPIASRLIRLSAVGLIFLGVLYMTPVLMFTRRSYVVVYAASALLLSVCSVTTLAIHETSKYVSLMDSVIMVALLVACPLTLAGVAFYRFKRPALRAEPDGPANRSQPIRAETNRTSAAAGSDR